MKLTDDWRQILRKAWSVRLMILAGLLSGIEVALPFFASDLPRSLFAGLSALVVAAALVARLAAQKDMP
jgi:hypothetical protein